VLLLTPMGLLRTGQAQETAGWTDLRGRSSYSLEEFAQALFPAAAPLVQTRGIGPPKTSTGLPVARVSVVLNVLFASNTEVIPSTAYADIDKLGTLLSWPQYADYSVQLEGHTDSQGAARKNLALSEKRVQSLKHYLVERFHVVPERVRAVGYGASRPLATNATPEGRSQNRRVEVVNLGPGQ
jgi:outer membrane protein OmpA-like peptidoglycan-associated protein